MAKFLFVCVRIFNGFRLFSSPWGTGELSGFPLGQILKCRELNHSHIMFVHPCLNRLISIPSNKGSYSKADDPRQIFQSRYSKADIPSHPCPRGRWVSMVIIFSFYFLSALKMKPFHHSCEQVGGVSSKESIPKAPGLCSPCDVRPVLALPGSWDEGMGPHTIQFKYSIPKLMHILIRKSPTRGLASGSTWKQLELSASVSPCGK